MNVYLNDKIIDDQGNVKTVASGQDARLYYVDVNGERKKYLLDGEATEKELDPIFSAISGTYALKTEVPTKTSQLENNSGFITEETDPVYTADKPNLALKTDLTNVVTLMYSDGIGTPFFGSNMFLDFTTETPVTELNLSLAAGLKNAAILFLTGDTITYTITNEGNYKVNRAFELEANSYYLIAIDGNVVLWTKVENYA